jgi:hypothetical protein
MKRKSSSKSSPFPSQHLYGQFHYLWSNALPWLNWIVLNFSKSRCLLLFFRELNLEQIFFCDLGLLLDVFKILTIMKGSFFIQYLELFGLEWNRIMFHGLEYLLR